MRTTGQKTCDGPWWGGRVEKHLIKTTARDGQHSGPRGGASRSGGAASWRGRGRPSEQGDQNRDRYRDRDRERDRPKRKGRSVSEEEMDQDGRAPPQQTVKNMYMNAQSLVKKVDEQACLTHIEKPDLILLTETWCHDERVAS